MARSPYEGRRQRRLGWAAWACVALGACTESASGGNAGGSGPGTDPPDVRDAAGGGAVTDAVDDAFGRDDGEHRDAPGLADIALSDVNADVPRGDGIVAGDAPSDGATVDADVPRGDGIVAGDAPSDGATVDAGQPETGGPVFDVGACVATVITPRRLVPALYLMIDSSTSMDTVDALQAMSRWGAINAAMPIFVDHAANNGTFRRPRLFPGARRRGGRHGAVRRDRLRRPSVQIGALGGPSSPQGAAITTAIAARSRTSLSPTAPALTGALQHARDWANSQAQLPSPINVVFVTDGQPVGCVANNNTLSAAVTAALAASNGTPSIKTHVIGVGTATGDLDPIAQAGGTLRATYVLESTGSSVAAALQSIRTSSDTCQLSIEGVQDAARVNFEIRDADGGATRLGKASDAASCGTANGWYYDSPAQPKTATLCPTPCAAVKAGASVAMLVGCATIILPP